MVWPSIYTLASWLARAPLHPLERYQLYTEGLLICTSITLDKRMDHQQGEAVEHGVQLPVPSTTGREAADNSLTCLVTS